MPIVKVNGGFKIRNVKGVSPTRAEAEERLRAIKVVQHGAGRKG